MLVPASKSPGPKVIGSSPTTRIIQSPQGEKTAVDHLDCSRCKKKKKNQKNFAKKSKKTSKKNQKEKEKEKKKNDLNL